jgi:hypothetical protein
MATVIVLLALTLAFAILKIVFGKAVVNVISDI